MDQDVPRARTLIPGSLTPVTAHEREDVIDNAKQLRAKYGFWSRASNISGHSRGSEPEAISPNLSRLPLQPAAMRSFPHSYGEQSGGAESKAFSRKKSLYFGITAWHKLDDQAFKASGPRVVHERLHELEEQTGRRARRRG